MKHFMMSLCALSMIGYMSLFGAETIVDQATGISFPTEVSFSANGHDYTLDATGVATRKKFFVKVYSVAHYLQKGAQGDLPQAILDDKNAKELVLKWDREVPLAKVQEGYHESFAKALSDSDKAKLKPQIDQYIALFTTDVKKGDEHVIRWLPGGDVQVIINDKPVGEIKNPDFAKASAIPAET